MDGVPDFMLSVRKTRIALVVSASAILSCFSARAAERVTVRGGAQFDCIRREADGDQVRLYLFPTVRANGPSESSNYVEVSAVSVLSVESIPDPVTLPLAQPAALGSATPLTPAEMTEMLSRAGSQHNIDADLLASVVKAESNGNAHAVSRAGAQGLMQLMPGTASTLGVHDSFVPEQNIGGGSAYLDELLRRYKDNLALALAAYNAGPLAVDRYHGIPPYRETRAYVARVIREFNRRKVAALANPAIASAAH
jgi:soluble lytic murein transglycosylase-like protein